MIFSMTGFGSAEGRVGQCSVSVELRTVNHRFFNPVVKLPGAFGKWEGDVRELLRQRIARGHVSLAARIDSDSVRFTGINEGRFAEYVTLLRNLQERHGLKDNLDAATILGLPEVVGLVGDDTEHGSAAELLALVEEAVTALREMRAEEGKRLGVFLLDRIDTIEECVKRIGERGPVRLADQAIRLRKSVKELSAAADVDQQRLAQEVAILADKLDISEELDRFNSHIESFRRTVQSSGAEPVGKRLGFILQELVREANTTGSKANDAAILANVVSVKEELERLREQVENIE